MKRYIRCSETNNVKGFISKINSYRSDSRFSAPVAYVLDCINNASSQTESDICWEIKSPYTDSFRSIEKQFDTAEDVADIVESEIGAKATVGYVKAADAHYKGVVGFLSVYIMHRGINLPEDGSTSAPELAQQVIDYYKKGLKAGYKHALERDPSMTPDDYVDKNVFAEVRSNLDRYVADADKLHSFVVSTFAPMYKYRKNRGR